MALKGLEQSPGDTGQGSPSPSPVGPILGTARCFSRQAFTVHTGLLLAPEAAVIRAPVSTSSKFKPKPMKGRGRPGAEPHHLLAWRQPSDPVCSVGMGFATTKRVSPPCHVPSSSRLSLGTRWAAAPFHGAPGCRGVLTAPQALPHSLSLRRGRWVAACHCV